MTDPSKTDAFVQFATDASNNVGQIKLDIGPLWSSGSFSKFIDSYVSVIGKLNAAGVTVSLMYSDNMAPGISYDLNTFNTAVTNLLAKLPASAAIGVSYDLEEIGLEKSGSTKYKSEWAKCWSVIETFTDHMVATRPSWAGFDMALPNVCVEECGASWLYQKATTLDSMYYFNAVRDFYKSSALPKIAELVSKCAKGSCKVRVGFETTSEVDKCVTYQVCRTSFIWGGGLTPGQTLLQWINSDLLASLSEAGVSADSLATPPFFVEDLSGYSAFVSNIKSGAIPCTGCSQDDNPDSKCPMPPAQAVMR